MGFALRRPDFLHLKWIIDVFVSSWPTGRVICVGSLPRDCGLLRPHDILLCGKWGQLRELQLDRWGGGDWP